MRYNQLLAMVALLTCTALAVCIAPLPANATDQHTLEIVRAMGPLRSVQPPRPFDPHIEKAQPDSTKALNRRISLPHLHRDLAKLRQLLRVTRNTQVAYEPVFPAPLGILAATFASGTHSQAGTDIPSASAGNQGMYANLTYYQNTSAGAVNPSSADIYDPTMRAPGTIDCIEVGTHYGPNGATPDWFVYNHCGTGDLTSVDKPINDTFKNTYGANYGDGLPEYTTEVVNESDGYHALLYNHAANNGAGAWDDIVTVTGNYPTDRTSDGWNIFELFGASTTATCPYMPEGSATGIRTSSDGSNFTLTNTSDIGTWGDAQGNPTGSCFDSTGYVWNWVSRFDQWTHTGGG